MELLEQLGHLTIPAAEALLDEVLAAAALGDDIAVVALEVGNRLLSADPDDPVGRGWLAVHDWIVAVESGL